MATHRARRAHRQVRAGYYNVLVAQEANKINAALLRFTNEVYVIQVQRLKNGKEAGYQPAQLRTLVVQARSALVQSQNRYISAWKQMAAHVAYLACLGDTGRSRGYAAARSELRRPLGEGSERLSRRAGHTHNLEAQARINLRLQQVTPVPDVTVYAGFFKDYTDPGTHPPGHVQHDDDGPDPCLRQEYRQYCLR